MSTARGVMHSLLAHFGPQHWWRDASQFEIVAGALLVQRTTWSNAARAIENLRKRGLLSIGAVAASDPDTLITLIRPAGFFRVKADRLRALASYIAAQGGFGPLDRLATHRLRQRFLDLPGIGPETADVILAYAFKRKTFVVDAYARRLFERLDAPHGVPSDAELKKHAEVVLGDVDSLNEFHALIVAHGKQYCRPRPKCHVCPLQERCRYPASKKAAGNDST